MCPDCVRKTPSINLQPHQCNKIILNQCWQRLWVSAYSLCSRKPCVSTYSLCSLFAMIREWVWLLMHSTMLLVTTSFQMLAIATCAIVWLQVLRKIVELLNANWKQLKCSPIELCQSKSVQTKPAIQQSSIFSGENSRIGEINHNR